VSERVRKSVIERGERERESERAREAASEKHRARERGIEIDREHGVR
jgi:hypothetical protein